LETPDPLLERVAPVLAAVPGVAAVALGGSRARGAAHAASDYDIGLYFSDSAGLDVASLLVAVRGLVDDPEAAAVTEGGGWLSIGRRKIDLLYRPIERVEKVIRDCREGRVTMDYQPGHPHGFCSAIWMGEVALCLPLSHPGEAIASLKAMTDPYPQQLADALIRRFGFEALFSIENAQTAIHRGDQNYVAGCAFHSLCCVAQVLFALNRRYLINEKGAIEAAARLPLTIEDLSERTLRVWGEIGRSPFDAALGELAAIERDLARLTEGAR
jgi:predicted nucleotidyltransferase